MRKMNPMKFLCLSILSLFSTTLLSGADALNGKPYRPGEVLEFRVYYHAWIGNLTAGYASLKVNEKPVRLNGYDTYHIQAEGKSRRAFNWFFKVHDRFETWLHPETKQPLKFMRRTREGNYAKDEDYLFDHKKGQVKSTRALTPIPPNTQDIISAIYYARHLDFKNTLPGTTFPIHLIFDDEVYTSDIVFEGRDTVKIDMGTFDCYKFRPRVMTGNVFEEEYPMTLWVTADENKIPVLAESEVLVGRVRLELIRVDKLAHPLLSGLILKN